MGGLLALKAAERHPVSAFVLIASELPGDVREPTEPHLIREIPELFGPSLLGWATLPEKLQRDQRDLNLADVLRVQHLMGQKPHESGRARRTMLRGVKVDPAKLGDIPRLVVGGGLDRVVPLEASERLATWLDAEYEPFGAHSHYGLILGEVGFIHRSRTRSAGSSRFTGSRSTSAACARAALRPRGGLGKGLVECRPARRSSRRRVRAAFV